MAKLTKHNLSPRLRTTADKLGVDEIVIQDNIPGIDCSLLHVPIGDKEVNIRFDTGADYEPLLRLAIQTLQGSK